jgi:F-type H+-transporting ATPase subunit gamma
MAGLKELKNKIGVIESTRKITSAMKLVAGVKLRKVEQKTASSREYSTELCQMLAKIRPEFLDSKLGLFTGRKQVQTVMLVIFSASRGLCGNFTYTLGKIANGMISDLHRSGKKIRVLCIGNKLFSTLKKLLKDGDFIECVDDFYNAKDMFGESSKIAKKIISDYKIGEIDEVSIVYTRYYSAVSRKVESVGIIPISHAPDSDKSVTIFEASAEKILQDILPYNITVQIYRCALESVASEQSSRVASMDNATRNADSLLSEFKIKYNRGRQLKITQELTEIIAGAAAVEG